VVDDLVQEVLFKGAEAVVEMVLEETHALIADVTDIGLKTVVKMLTKEEKISVKENALLVEK